MIVGNSGGIVGSLSDITYLTGQQAHEQGYINITSAGSGRGGSQCKVTMNGYIGRNLMEIKTGDDLLIYHDIYQGEGYSTYATNGMYLPLFDNNGTICQIPSGWTKSALYFKPSVREVQILDGQFIGLVTADFRGLYVVWYEGDYIPGVTTVHEAPAYQYLRSIEGGTCYYWYRHIDMVDVLEPVVMSLPSITIADTAHAGASGFDPETGKWLFTTYSRLDMSFSGIRLFSSYNDIIQYFENPDEEPEEDDNVDELRDSINIENDLSSVLIMGTGVFNNFAQTLYPSSQSVMDDVLAGLEMYGENPVNFIVDAFYIPFDPYPLASGYNKYVDAVQQEITNFGRYAANIDRHWKVTDIKTVTIGSVAITGNYNDFRDYTTKNLYLLLPFCGTQHLDTEKYIYKTLTLKAFFDVRTGIIKYYVYAGNSIMDMFQGSVKSEMPVAGSNRSEGMRNIISSAGQMMVGGARTLAGDLTGMGDVIGGFIGTTKASPKSVSGGFSAEGNLMDPLMCKLVIEDVECYYPSNIVSNYGRPDNRVGNLGSNTGFIQADKVQLHSTQTLARQEEIKRLLREGVII